MSTNAPVFIQTANGIHTAFVVGVTEVGFGVAGTGVDADVREAGVIGLDGEMEPNTQHNMANV